MVVRHTKGVTTSPAIAALVSGVLSSILTLLTAILPLRSHASDAAIFLFFLWTLILLSLVVVGVIVWIYVNECRDERRNTLMRMELERQALQHLSSLEAHVPQLIRFVKRTDTFNIQENGDSELVIEGEVESPNEDHVPWLALPVLAEVAKSRVEWTSIQVNSLVVNGKRESLKAAFVRRDRRHYYDDVYHADRWVETGFIKVPIGLRPGQSSCRFSVSMTIVASTSTMDHELWYSDVNCVTNELEVTLIGAPGCTLTCSSRADHKVEAVQLGAELVDVPESSLQSSNCIVTDAVRWETKTAKVGYRYRIATEGSVSAP